MPKGLIGFIKRVTWIFRAIKNYLLFLRDFLGIVKERDIIYHTRNNVEVIARAKTEDKSEIVLIFSDREYPKKYFPENRHPVIIDIGAHIGCFSLYIERELEKSNPKIYSIEPSNENFQYLIKNNRLNEAKLKCFNIAITDKNGKGFLNKDQSFDSFTVEETINRQIINNYQKCQTMTLESFCHGERIEKIDLLKVDCEGSEYKIFKKSIDFIKKNIKFIFIEIHNIGKFENYHRFEKYVLKNDFRIVKKIFPTVVFLENESFQETQKTNKIKK